jgi:glycosyltransferase involved in cell wall biosynthesis
MNQRVAMVINTSGLAYDDRLRKECDSLQRVGARPEILALERRNQPGQGSTDSDHPYRTLGLASRRWLPHHRGLVVKLLELYGRMVADLLRRRPDVAWVHDPDLGGVVAAGILLRRLGVIQRVVWDQHELPPMTMLRSTAGRALLAETMSRCDAIVVANRERGIHLAEVLGPRVATRMHSLDNYSDAVFNDRPAGRLPAELRDWLGGRSFLLAQGGANPRRFLDELVTAVLRRSDVALVVVGPYLEAAMSRLRSRFGAELAARVHFTGLVPQMELINYIDEAIASVVLYDLGVLNSRLCAPNRLYQALSRGVPVLVGCNPPLARVVTEHACGVVLEQDGRDVEDLAQGLQTLLANAGTLRARTRACRGLFAWESQDPVVASILAGRRS